MSFKIKVVDANNAIWLGEEKGFSFNNQTSEKKFDYVLRTGDNFYIDGLAVHMEIIEGQVLEVFGSFINFYDKAKPIVTLCITKIYGSC